jgi:hypothetical protein
MPLKGPTSKYCYIGVTNLRGIHLNMDTPVSIASDNSVPPLLALLPLLHLMFTKHLQEWDWALLAPLAD